MAASPGRVGVGTTGVGGGRGGAVTVANGGTAALAVTSVTSSDAQFWAGRTKLVVAAGATDTVGVYYRPVAAGYDSATLTVVGDDPGSPHTVHGTGRGVPGVGGEGG